MSKNKKEKPDQNYGPGNVLRNKRVEYEWSVEAVAESLHLSTSSIKAIEADRYDDLPGATYVLGYWRSYARLLGIDLEDTIEANKRNLDIFVPESRGLDVSTAYHPVKRSGILFRLAGLVLLVGLAYYVWQQNFFGLFEESVSDEQVSLSLAETEPTEEANPEETEESNVLRSIDQPEQAEQPGQPVAASRMSDSLLEDKTATEADNQAEDNITTEADAQNTPDTQAVSESALSGLIIQRAKNEAAEPGDASTLPLATNLLNTTPSAQSGLVLRSDQAQAQNSADEKNVEAASTAPSVEDTTEETAEQTTGDETAEATPASGEEGDKPAQDDTNTESQTEANKPTDGAALDDSTVVLNLSKDSWLDVRDKTNKRLVYTTEKAGSEVKVVGTPPFYIYIGTPSGVKVRYMGKNVPFETHKSGLFARFKLSDTLEPL